MINVPYRFARWQASRARARFVRRMRRGELRFNGPGKPLSIHLVTFSGVRDLPEQMASLLTFFRFAGTPEQTTVVSDGTHQQEEKDILARLHSSVRVVHHEQFTRTASPKVRAYADHHPLGKKLAVLAGIPVDGPTIYSDSDILFFPAAGELAGWLREGDGTPRYLLDCWPSLDERLLRGEAEKAAPLNSGFLVMHRKADWSEAMARLDAMSGEAGFFTEQTVVHLAFRSSGGKHLPQDLHVMQNDDQWGYADTHARRRIVLRHYIGSFRHKMWLQAGRLLKE